MIRADEQKSILVVSATERIAGHVLAIAPPARFTVATAQSCGAARRALIATDYDVLLINAPLPDEFGVELALDRVRNSSGGVILLAAADHYADVAAKLEPYGVLTAEKPLSRSYLSTLIRLCIATRARLQAFAKKNESLTAKMDEIRTVNRAKWALIRTLNMQEEQAHKYIEKQAMNLRLSKREVAENIIRTYEE